MVRVVVATSPNFAGVPEVVVQYGTRPAVSFVEVLTGNVLEPHPVQVPEMVMFLKNPLYLRLDGDVVPILLLAVSLTGTIDCVC